MSLFLIDIKEYGSALAAVPIATMVNHGTNQLFIDNLVVPREALVGEEGKGFSYLLSSLNAERILVASQRLATAAGLSNTQRSTEISGGFLTGRSQ